MKYPIFTTFVIFCLLATLYLKRSQNKLTHLEDDFWEKEKEANAVARKPLTEIVFIDIPEEPFAEADKIENEDVLECLNTISDLRSKKITNLNGVTNTELKLKYGVTNLEMLSEADSNYSLLCSTIGKLGQALYNDGHSEEAEAVLEYGVSIGSDVKVIYTLLADIYAEKNDFDRIDTLIESASGLNSIMKNPILRDLKSKSLSSTVYDA